MGGLDDRARTDSRTDAMARSIASAAVAQGLDRAAVDLVSRACALALEPRVARLEDDHHPAYLHPGRSVLILFQDVGPVPGAALAAAAVLESQDRELRLPVERVSAVLGEGVAASVSTIPLPADDRLVERLIGLGADLALAALAERLDNLRHLHLREDLEAIWPDQHQEVTAVWLPFAQRVHPKLAIRFAHWARTFVARI